MIKRLLSASFDGTAKIWPWNSNNFEANREMKTLFVFEGELGKVRDCGSNVENNVNNRELI